MRGPGLRLEHDVRRIWTCPVCGRIERHLGHVTSVNCPCPAHAWMVPAPPPDIRRPKFERIDIPEDPEPEPVIEPKPALPPPTEPVVIEALAEPVVPAVASGGREPPVSPNTAAGTSPRHKQPALAPALNSGASASSFEETGGSRPPLAAATNPRAKQPTAAIGQQPNNPAAVPEGEIEEPSTEPVSEESAPGPAGERKKSRRRRHRSRKKPTDQPPENFGEGL